VVVRGEKAIGVNLEGVEALGSTQYTQDDLVQSRTGVNRRG
jgi:hypothetical protein